MASDENCTNEELLQAQRLFWKHSFGYISTLTLQSAVQLGIPDIIHEHGGRGMKLSELIAALEINPSKAAHISRLMRILVHSGFFVQETTTDKNQGEEEGGRGGGYALTLAGRILLSHSPLTMISFLHPSGRKPLECLVDWLRNDDPTAFHTATGKSTWDHLAQEQQEAYLFKQSMANDSGLVMKVVISQCKHVFVGLTSLVDVGGGSGTAARAIAEAFPDLKCTVLDQPHVVANQLGTTNLDFVGGDLFEKIPPSNAVLLKWILHDWPDEECVKILKKCKEAIPSKDNGGKLIIIDMVVEVESRDKDLAALQLFWDINMLVLCAGKERNKREWEKLFLDAGFNDYKITPILDLRSVIEVYP